MSAKKRRHRTGQPGAGRVRPDSEYLLTAHVFGDLSPVGVEEVERRLAASEELRCEYERLVATRDLLREALVGESPDGKIADGGEVADGEEAEDDETPARLTAERLLKLAAERRRRRLRFRVVVGSAAACALLCFSVFYSLTSSVSTASRPYDGEELAYERTLRTMTAIGREGRGSRPGAAGDAAVQWNASAPLVVSGGESNGDVAFTGGAAFGVPGSLQKKLDVESVDELYVTDLGAEKLAKAREPVESLERAKAPAAAQDRPGAGAEPAPDRRLAGRLPTPPRSTSSRASSSSRRGGIQAPSRGQPAPPAKPSSGPELGLALHDRRAESRFDRFERSRGEGESDEEVVEFELPDDSAVTAVTDLEISAVDGLVSVDGKSSDAPASGESAVSNGVALRRTQAAEKNGRGVKRETVEELRERLPREANRQSLAAGLRAGDADPAASPSQTTRSAMSRDAGRMRRKSKRAMVAAKEEAADPTADRLDLLEGLTDTDGVHVDIPKGTDLDNITNYNLNAIGVGAGAAGAYGERVGNGALAGGALEDKSRSLFGSSHESRDYAEDDAPAFGAVVLRGDVRRKFAQAERELRGWGYYSEFDRDLSLLAYQQQSGEGRALVVPPPAVGDEGLGRDGFRERYGVNPFVDTRFDRHSTFSLGVDTASFTRARARLRAGQLPDPETVRVEAFVNQFRDDCPPAGEDAFSVCAAGGPSPFGAGLELLKVTVKARELRADERRRAVLTLAIDTSGSMHHASSLRLMRQSIDALVGSLRPNDQLAIVAYSSHAYVVLPHTPAREQGRIAEALGTLVARGGTNVEGGLDLAYRLADEMLQPKAVNRVILCSDGVANVGARDPERMLDKVKAYARRGVYLSVIGFGQKKYNDRFLETISREGNGNYRYVADIEEAKAVFERNLPETLQVLAEDAKIQVEFDPQIVAHYRLLGYEKRDIADKDFRNDAVDAAEVGPGSTVTAIYEIERHRGAHGALGTVFVRFRATATRRIEEQAFPLAPGVLAAQVELADDDLLFRAAAAEVAELLRESYWARDGSFADVLALLADLSPEFQARPEWQELFEVAMRAQMLTVQRLARGNAQK